MGKHTEEEFNQDYLTEALNEYIESNQAYTGSGTVDYDKLSAQFGINTTTLRQVVAGTASPRWETWNIIMEKLGKKVVAKRK